VADELGRGLDVEKETAQHFEVVGLVSPGDERPEQRMVLVDLGAAVL
jgi:hypothetical protein